MLLHHRVEILAILLGLFRRLRYIASVHLERYPITGSISITVGAAGTGSGSGYDGGAGRCKIWI